MGFPPNWLDHPLLMTNRDSNWPSLNLSQNLREGWTNSCWKRQVLMFYPQGKNSGKPYGGIHPTPPVRSNVKSQFYFNSDKEVVTEGFFLSSFFACKICNHRLQTKKTNILPLSYGSLSPLPSPPPVLLSTCPPPPPGASTKKEFYKVQIRLLKILPCFSNKVCSL